MATCTSQFLHLRHNHSSLYHTFWRIFDNLSTFFCTFSPLHCQVLQCNHKICYNQPTITTHTIQSINILSVHCMPCALALLLSWLTTMFDTSMNLSTQEVKQRWVRLSIELGTLSTHLSQHVSMNWWTLALKRAFWLATSRKRCNSGSTLLPLLPAPWLNPYDMTDTLQRYNKAIKTRGHTSHTVYQLTCTSASHVVEMGIKKRFKSSRVWCGQNGYGADVWTVGIPSRLLFQLRYDPESLQVGV